MKLTLLVIGKTNSHYVKALIDDYANRIAHYLPFTIDVIPELRATKSQSIGQQKSMEAELIRKQIQPGDYLVLLDEHGSERRSVDFAKWIEKRMVTGAKRLVFLVGGPYGFAEEIHALAQEEISLSKMTFSHQLIRLLFVEQLYRAQTILRGEPYHHE
ncbi:MAG: 23S rRNA (pseudouridine(1915)-N(3))-methyltransferase RlmH [Bacteroidaceae bacterium]|nr:23S rRNA (pseudouridine(1915)-N(3))-methyltransferase RlmH [Bacteroidaceae bacterium]